MRRIASVLNNSKGLTLIEILASITILSIIIVSFLTFFIQSARTNTISEDMMDATYVAQSEMEHMYHLSTQYSFNDAILELENNSSYAIKDNSFTTTKGGYFIVITLEKQERQLGEVLVEVYENSSMEKVQAQMETIYNWGDSN